MQPASNTVGEKEEGAMKLFLKITGGIVVLAIVLL
jgi:hypothetical protein